MRIDLSKSKFFQELKEQHFFDIREAISKKWDDLVVALKHHNRFFPNQSFTELFSRFSYFEENLPKQTILYRGRILHQDLYKHIKFIDGFPKGLPAEMMGAPPSKIASSGRANPKGISYLYLASTIETACAEVRPIRNECISVSRFKTSDNLRIINLHKKLDDSLYQKLGGENVGFFYALRDAFMKPYREHDEENYLPTQYVASYLQHIGYDGITYRSAHNSSSNAYNIVLFNPKNATCMDKYGQIFFCLKTSLTFQNIATDGVLFPFKEDTPEDVPLDAAATTEEYLSVVDKMNIITYILNQQKS